MTGQDRETISGMMAKAHPMMSRDPYMIDAAILGPVSRPRLYWTSFELGDTTSRLRKLSNARSKGVPMFGQQELRFDRGQAQGKSGCTWVTRKGYQ